MTAPYYQDDWVTLYYGDCLEVSEWLQADVLVADPPYGIAWKSRSTSWYKGSGGWPGQRGESSRVSQKPEAINGDQNPDLRDAVLLAWAPKPAVVFGSWRVPRPPGVQHRLIWYKKGRAPGPTAAPWFAADEEIYVVGGGFVGPPVQNVYVTSEGRASAVRDFGHPAVKPVNLMESLIGKCPPGVIADPFTGSGSTLVAAKALGRRSVGVELEERYCELTANRLAQDVLDFEAG